jgi:hypothetical protein
MSEKPKKKLVIRKKDKDKKKVDEALEAAEEALEKDQPFQFAFDFGSFYDSSDHDDL